MEIKIENNLSANEYNNLRSKIGWDTKDIEVVQNAIKNSIIWIYVKFLDTFFENFFTFLLVSHYPNMPFDFLVHMVLYSR